MCWNLEWMMVVMIMCCCCTSTNRIFPMDFAARRFSRSLRPYVSLALVEEPAGRVVDGKMNCYMGFRSNVVNLFYEKNIL